MVYKPDSHILPIIICMIYSSIALTIVCHNWWARFYSKICDFMLCIKRRVCFPFRWFHFLSSVLVQNHKRYRYDLNALHYHYLSWQVVISPKLKNFLYHPQWLWSRLLYLEKLFALLSSKMLFEIISKKWWIKSLNGQH